MYALVKPFLDLCLLRRAPQDLPSSDLLLWLVLVTHTVSGILLSVVTLSFGQALLAGIMDTLLLAGLTVSVLYIHRLYDRFKQTLTALAGAGTVLGLLALPITGWFHAARSADGDTSGPILVLLVLIGWSITVAGHILRHALSTVFILGIVVALIFYWISINIMNRLFPIAV